VQTGGRHSTCYGKSEKGEPAPVIPGSRGCCLEKAIPDLGAGCREAHGLAAEEHGVLPSMRLVNPESHCRGPIRQPLRILAVETLRLTPFKLEQPVTYRALWLSKRATETHFRTA